MKKLRYTHQATSLLPAGRSTLSPASQRHDLAMLPDTHARPSRGGYYTHAVTARAPQNEKLGRRTYPWDRSLITSNGF